MNLTGEQRVDYFHFKCRHCGNMPEIEYAGMDGCVPLFNTICDCGVHTVKIFNRCDRFPAVPREAA